MRAYRVATANFATAGWRSVGPIRRRRIRRMARAVAAQKPDEGTLTEAAWLPEVRAIIVAEFGPAYSFSTARGSVLLFWRVPDQRRFKGWGDGGHGEVRAGRDYISDRRPNRNAVLLDTDARRKHRLIGFHWAPIRPKLGGDAVRAGQRAQDLAIRRLRETVGKGGLVKVGAGDSNNHTRYLGDEVNGREVRYAGDVIPDRIWVVGAPGKRVSIVGVYYPTLPGGDHYRGRTKTGRRRPVFLVATVRIREVA